MMINSNGETDQEKEEGMDKKNDPYVDGSIITNATHFVYKMVAFLFGKNSKTYLK